MGLVTASATSTAIAQSSSLQAQRSRNEVTLIVNFRVQQNVIEQFKQRMIRQAELSRAEAGCVIFNIHQSNQDPQIFWLYEKWYDQAALDFHFAQTYTQELFEFFKESLEVPVEEGLDYVTDLVSLPLS